MNAIILATLIATGEPTDAQIAACYADALRLCSQHIGDHNLMRACMVAHKDDISKQCKEAFRK